MNPDVTILITIFNGSKTIDRCLKSIFEQSYKNTKVVCVEDKSTDDTLEKILVWQKKFGPDRFLIIRNEVTMGVTKSSNRGLTKINTAYTARIDADDWWDKNKLEKQINFLIKNPDYKIIGCNYININGNIKKGIITAQDDNLIKKTIIKNNPFAHSCVIYETELAKKIGGYDETIKYGGDYELYLRFFPFTKFYNIQEFLCFRSVENEGISIKRQKEQMLQGIKTQLKYVRKYNLPKFNYIYITKLIAVILTPKLIRNLKRAILG